VSVPGSTESCWRWRSWRVGGDPPFVAQGEQKAGPTEEKPRTGKMPALQREAQEKSRSFATLRMTICCDVADMGRRNPAPLQRQKKQEHRLKPMLLNSRCRPEGAGLEELARVTYWKLGQGTRCDGV
jgi:hypothetical protein